MEIDWHHFVHKIYLPYFLYECLLASQLHIPETEFSIFSACSKRIPFVIQDPIVLICFLLGEIRGKFGSLDDLFLDNLEQNTLVFGVRHDKLSLLV